MTETGTPAVVEAIQASAEEVGYKVFVGNLAFSTKETELQEIFGKIGPVSSAQIINRGTRSLGYGFVTFTNEEDATKATSTLDKTEIAGRTINVELAKPAPSTPAGNIAKQAAEAAGAPAGEDDGEPLFKSTRGRGRGRGRFRGRGRGRGRGGRRIRPDGEADEDAPTKTEQDKPEQDKEEGDPTNGVSEGVNGRGGRRARGRGRGFTRIRTGPPSGEASKTQLFVANLPFNIDEEGLKSIFEGFNIKSAHVIRRKYGPVAGKSKGFGFIELADEAEQKKALSAIHGKEIEGREVQVKIAINNADDHEDRENGHEGESTVIAS